LFLLLPLFFVLPSLFKRHPSSWIAMMDEVHTRNDDHDHDHDHDRKVKGIEGFCACVSLRSTPRRMTGCGS
jgi:hypothetical protein